MRISTLSMQQQTVNAMLEQQSKLAQTQQQLATGQRILSPADDPTGAVRSLDLTQALSKLDRYGQNADLAENHLQLEESTLSSVSDVLQRVRELTLQANNDTQDSQSRASITKELSGLLDDSVGLANSRDPSGNYLFSGYQSNTAPFMRGADGTFSYQGDDGQRQLALSDSRKVAINDAGADIFARIRNGNGIFTTSAGISNTGNASIDAGSVTSGSNWQPGTYTLQFITVDTYEVRDAGGNLLTSGDYQSGSNISFAGGQVSLSGTPNSGDSFTIAPSSNQDMFTTLKNIQQALMASGTDSTSQAQMHSALARGLSEIDLSLDHVLDARAQIGARLNTIDDQRDINQGASLALQQAKSGVEDLDYTTAISQMNMQMLGVQAAQQSFVKVQSLSLFNFLK